jgi:hypothetical protein
VAETSGAEAEVPFHVPNSRSVSVVVVTPTPGATTSM